MNTDELRTLLKEAGRPVSSPVDPVPVIRRRARRHRRTQVAAAVACTAVVAAGVVGAIDLWPRDSTGPAGRSAQGDEMRPLLPFSALDATPQEVGDRTLLDAPPPHRELEAGGGLYLGMDGLQSNDLVRVRMVCPTATASNPVMLEVSLQGFTEQQLDPPPTPPGDPVPGAREVACTNTISSTDFVVPAGWPRYAVTQVDLKPDEARSLKLEVAAYR